ncbi:hypothetical protein C8A01DRAFT_39168 [Parachaetomium inaequale]|uniref:RNA ligase domain-containing protein n=1 Tax=Parachaetomium inaequale TaxID=2588326 RepID=A0AAN6PCQ4_9PEZI|nr:hypothetical protein C8A01DRAFT_39168 [Parachaetomium inaequale]
MSAQAKGADLRAWLDAAIFSADAALPLDPPGIADAGIADTGIAGTGIADTGKEASASEPVVASSKTEAEITAESALVRAEVPSHKRNLATVRRITAVMAIDDDHDVLTIDGWKVVADKTENFSRGEYVLFFEIDSFLPAGSEFEEWFTDIGPPITFNGETGYRVGTSVWTDKHDNEIISQGHVFHLSDFPEIDEKVCDLHWEHVNETEEQFADFLCGIDFSDEFGVKKWESFPEIVQETPDMPARMAENMKAPMSVPKTNDNTRSIPTSNPKPPSFIIKADMERVQNCPNLFTKPKYQNFLFQESVKMDGANMTIYFVSNDSNIDMPALPTPDHTNHHTFLKFAVHPNGRLGVCTRAQDLLPHLLPSKSVPSHTPYWTATLAAGLHLILPALNSNLAIQAELVGASIQGNPYHYPEGSHELLVFAITEFTACTSKRWDPRRVETFAQKHGLKHVPVLGYRTIPSVARNHQDLVVRAELKKGEGLVFKNCTDERWFKVLSNRWILEKGDEMHARAAAQGGKKGNKKKGKDKGGVKKEVVPVPQVVERPKKWEASREQVQIIRLVFRDLKDWIQRDDGLKKWMEEWNMGFHGDPGGAKEVEGSAGVTVQETVGSGMMESGQTNGKAAGANSAAIDFAGTNSVGISFTVSDYTGTGPTAANSTVTNPTVTNSAVATSTGTHSVTKCAAAESAGVPLAAIGARIKLNSQTTDRFGVSAVKRNELADWLGVEGFGL